MSDDGSKQIEKNGNIAADFSKMGFILLKNVFSEDYCDQIRTQILSKFYELQTLGINIMNGRLSQSQAFSIADAWKFLVHEKVIQALKEILEHEYTLIPNFTAHKNIFGVSPISIAKITIPRRFGWHVDAGGEPKDSAQVDPDYRVVKCGLYLQDNGSEFGGGIDVVPGSHNLLLRTGVDRLDDKIRLFKGKLGIIFNNKTIPIKKGDVVIFDSFLMHSATHPEGIFENMTEYEKKTNYFPSIPTQNTKLTLYFDACRSQFAPRFLKVAIQRAKKELDSVSCVGANRDLAFCEQIRFFFEQTYPKECLDIAKKHAIHFSQLDGSDLEEAKQVYQSYKAL